MREGSKTLIGLLATLLVGLCLTACGGDDGPDSTTAKDAGQAPTAVEPTGHASKGDGSRSGEDESKAGSDDGGGADGGGGQSDGPSSGSSPGTSFVPKEHEDSGGGSEQVRVKGGDNSVQEFGKEASSSELDAAAAAVHNFLDARAQEAWAGACSFLAAGVRKSLESLAVRAQEAAAKAGEDGQFGATNCATVLATLTNRAALPEMRREAALADVRSLRLEGDRAFVIYTAMGGVIIAIPMSNEDGVWKVAALAGTPLN